MAQSREMYIESGKLDRKNGVTARYDSAYSWQAKAYLEGFNMPAKASKAKTIKGAKPAQIDNLDGATQMDMRDDETLQHIPASDVQALQESFIPDDFGQKILDTLKLSKPVKVIASRRQREGDYCGKASGKHVRDQVSLRLPRGYYAAAVLIERG